MQSTQYSPSLIHTISKQLLLMVFALVLSACGGSNSTDPVGFAGDDRSVVFGDVNFTQTAVAQEGGGVITYSSNNVSVATVNESTGEVSIIGAGSAIITVNIENIGRDSYVLSVERAALLTFSYNAGNVFSVSRFVSPFSRTIDGNSGGGVIIYSVQNPSTGSVASIDPDTGLISLQGSNIGEAVLTARVAQSENYQAASASFTLDVTNLAPQNPDNLTFTTTPVSALTTDGSFTRLATSNGGVGDLTYASSDTFIATVNSV